MGEASSRIRRFIELHPNCCFCGGTHPTESIDHLPPKSMFISSQIPQKFKIEFPACKTCNRGSSQFDQAAALLAFTSTDWPSGETEAHFRKLIRGVRNNANSVAHEIMDGFVNNKGLEKKYSNLLGKKVVVSRIGDNTRKSLRVLTAKLGLAYFYEKTGKIVPIGGAVTCHVLTNADLSTDGLSADLDWELPFKDASETLPNKNQFLIRYQILEDNSGGIFQFGFHTNLLCVAIVFTDKSAHPIDLDSDQTFLPGFVGELQSPPNIFRTSASFNI